VRRRSGYLIGEEVPHLPPCCRRQRRSTRRSPPEFVCRGAGTIFRQPGELREYLCGVRRLGAAAHVLSEAQYEEMSAAGALGDDVRFEPLKNAILLEARRSGCSCRT